MSIKISLLLGSLLGLLSNLSLSLANENAASMFSTGGRALQGGTGGPGGGSNETFPSNLLPLCYAEVTMYHPSPMGPACLASNKYATRFMMTECTLVSNSSGSPPMWGRLGCNSSTYGGSIMFSSPTCKTRCKLASTALRRLPPPPIAADIPRCILSSTERPETKRAFSSCCQIGA